MTGRPATHCRCVRCRISPAEPATSEDEQARLNRLRGERERRAAAVGEMRLLLRQLVGGGFQILEPEERERLLAKYATRPVTLNGGK